MNYFQIYFLAYWVACVQCFLFPLKLSRSIVSNHGFQHAQITLQQKSTRNGVIYSLLDRKNDEKQTTIDNNSDIEGTNYCYVGGPHINTSIFCNVELNGANLQAVGFDMDFTLAQYNDEFNALFFEEAKKHLYNVFGYPREILTVDFNVDKFCRGLIVDTKRGNILKTNRHHYVCVGYHGNSLLDTDERKVYAKQAVNFKEKHFFHVDTFYALVNVVLYNHVVELRDSLAATNSKMNQSSYEKLFSDVMKAVDICHTDGYLKNLVMENPSRFIYYDPNLVPLLKQLRASRKKVFLLTNSFWEYTNQIMDYLVHGGGEHLDSHWEDFFDIVIVGANKPAFLREDYLTILKLDRHGKLENVEESDGLHPRIFGPGAKRFQGGCWQDLHQLLDITSGDLILYVGDHIYADILRSKKSLGWRTCLIIPELENELTVAHRETKLKQEMYELQRSQWELEERIDFLRFYSAEKEEFLEELFKAEKKSKELKKQIARVTGEYGAKFNKQWGQLFKAKSQGSRFASQVLNFACLYTSRATNLRYVSPNRVFRPIPDFMPHDRALYEKEVLDIELENE